MKKHLPVVLIILWVMGWYAAESLARPAKRTRMQTQTCPLIFPEGAVVVAPNQPPVEAASTKGIINALCEVTLNIANLNFIPTHISLSCDTNGDGVDDRTTALKNLTVINDQQGRATISPVPAQAVPGTAFPISCCGGIVNLTMSRVDDAGQTMETQTCAIDIGLRAPVVIAVSPSQGSFNFEQNLLLTGTCFLLPDGTANVTSVFAVERDNPNNVIQAQRFVILNNNLIDTFFDFRGQNKLKGFFIYVSGVTGTSRNLTARPAGAQENCPLGNEQGIQITFADFFEVRCGPSSPVSELCPCRQGDTRIGCTQILSSCGLKRNASGNFTLTLRSTGLEEGSTLTINGATPKKVAFKNRDGASGFFRKVIVKGDLCAQLPGSIIVKKPNGEAYAAFTCAEDCSTK